MFLLLSSPFFYFLHLSSSFFFFLLLSSSFAVVVNHSFVMKSRLRAHKRAIKRGLLQRFLKRSDIEYYRYPLFLWTRMH
jgi:hypothetical protein